MANFLSKILSFGSDKELKEYRRITDEVNALEPRFHAMSDEELSGSDRRLPRALPERRDPG